MSSTPSTAIAAPTISSRLSRSPSHATPSPTPNRIEVRDSSEAVPGSTYRTATKPMLVFTPTSRPMARNSHRWRHTTPQSSRPRMSTAICSAPRTIMYIAPAAGGSSGNNRRAKM